MDAQIDLEAVKADTVVVSKTAFNYVVDEVQKLIDETTVDVGAILPLVKFIHLVLWNYSLTNRNALRIAFGISRK